jgi:hypothetical protein
VPNENDLRLQLEKERRETDLVNAKRDERMSVLEAKFDSLKGSYKILLTAFIGLCVSVLGSAVLIILTAGGGVAK